MTADSFAKVLAAALLAGMAPSITRAQDVHCERGDVEVRGLGFRGNATFPGAELANVIVTTPSAWARRSLNLPFSTKRCLNRAEFVNDRLRLILFYRRHGFPNVAVDTTVAYDGHGGARIQFAITEGPPIRVRSLTVTGLDSVHQRASILRHIAVKPGDRFDRVQISAVMDTIARRLRAIGYPSTTVEQRYMRRADSVAGAAANVPASTFPDALPEAGADTSANPTATGLWADDTIAVRAGPFTRVGAVTIDVAPAPQRRRAIGDNVVRTIAGIDSGSVVREPAMLDAQRALYETDAYAHVSVGLDSVGGQRIGPDSVAPLRISLVENPMHAARVGLGYGTLDCLRTTGELDDYNFLQGARRLELRARVSKIGAPDLCQQARQDPYSTHLNYYLGATLSQPVFRGLRTVPTLTAYTSRVSEYNAYVRTTTVGGIASIAWGRSRQTPPVTLAYSMDYGRTEAQPALFCSVFNLCTADDRERVQTNQRLGVLSLALARDRSNNTISPTKGGTFRFEIRHASPAVLSDTALQFNTLLTDLTRYISLGGQRVLALRLRGGVVFDRHWSTNTGFIPPQERMYAGGPTTVRGFPQNELGSITYTASQYDTVVDPSTGETYFRVPAGDSSYRRAVPVGGNALVVANAEFRFPSPFLSDVLQFAAFLDAGDVWNRGISADFQRFKLKITPGVQVAALTPIGPIRVVLGYNPYQLPPGPIYYENTAAAGGLLPCVSPDNTIPVVNGEQKPKIGGEGCTASFRPSQNQSLRSRLTFGLALGQAF